MDCTVPSPPRDTRTCCSSALRQHGVQPHHLPPPLPPPLLCPTVAAALCHPVVSHHRPARPPVRADTVRQGPAGCVLGALLGAGVHPAPGGVHEGCLLSLNENMSAKPATDQGTGERICKGQEEEGAYRHEVCRARLELAVLLYILDVWHGECCFPSLLRLPRPDLFFPFVDCPPPESLSNISRTALGHIPGRPSPGTHQVLLSLPARLVVPPAARYQLREAKKRSLADVWAPHLDHYFGCGELRHELYLGRCRYPLSYGLLRHSLTSK